MELSVGDFVMTGGEIPAMTVIDTVSRLVPGVLAAETSYEVESHFNGLLEYPQYTRPGVGQRKTDSRCTYFRSSRENRTVEKGTVTH